MQDALIEKEQKKEKSFWHQLCLCCYQEQPEEEEKLNVVEELTVEKKRESSQLPQPQISEDSQRQVSAEKKINSNFNSKLKSKKEFPKYKTFFLESRGRKAAIIAKITEKNFKLPKRNESEHHLRQREAPSLHDEVEDDPFSSTPIQIANYQAQRVRGTSLLVDLCCGRGGNLIQFAKACDNVIGVESDKEQIEQATKVCQDRKISEKVDLILANCLHMRNLKADIVFLNPSVTKSSSVNLYVDCTPNLEQSLSKALEIAPSLMVMLPYCIDLLQLPQIFSKAVKSQLRLRNNTHLIRQDYAIEIEEIQVDGIPEYYVIYYGAMASFRKHDTTDFLTHFLLRSGSDYNGIDFTPRLFDILSDVRQMIGQYSLLQRCLQAQQFSKIQQTVLQSFINQLVSDKLIDEETLRQSLHIKAPQKPARSIRSLQDESMNARSKSAIPQLQKEDLAQASSLKKNNKYLTPYEDKIISPNEFTLDDHNGSNPSYVPDSKFVYRNETWSQIDELEEQLDEQEQLTPSINF